MKTFKIWFVVLTVLVLGGLLLIETPNTALGQEDPTSEVMVGETITPAISPAVRDLPPGMTVERTLNREEINPMKNPGLFLSDFGLTGTDTKNQDPLAPNGVSGFFTPNPIFTFEGQGDLNQYTPPDTTGDVGPNHYIQMVNVYTAIYDKSGALLTQFPNNALWAGFGGPCQNDNNGDPIVLYDDMANRWMLSQFAVSSGLSMCLAISQTPDPLGAYYLYEFPMPDFPDYPKLGVWPDGYYLGTNTGFPNQYYAHVFERAEMLVGGAAGHQYVGGQANFLMPADADGQIAPPAGEPGLFYTFFDNVWPNHPAGVDRLGVFELDVDWSTPANSTFSLVTELPIANFNYTVCGFFAGDCIPQPGTAQRLDSVSPWPMVRLQYRNFGSHEAMVGNFTVDVNGTDWAGIRWFELRRSGGSWTLHQEGTYAPDSDHRWMGSIAMDGDGNIALGYSVSSASTYPSIRYTVHEVGDPLGTMQAEATMWAGSGSNTGPYDRWGDYSAMVVDPVDQSTFWYTNEYHNVNESSFMWNTRIGSFKIPTSVEPGCLQILFDETHGWGNDPMVGDYTIEDGFTELAAFLRDQGHIVESLQDPAPFDYTTISQYDVLALMLPKEYYSTAEKDAITSFVNEGGRLVTIGENGGFAGVSHDILNDVHVYLGDGLAHNADIVYDPTDFVTHTYWPLIHNFSPDMVNAGVNTVLEYLASSLQTTGPAYGTAFGDEDTYTQPSMAAPDGGSSGTGTAPYTLSALEIPADKAQELQLKPFSEAGSPTVAPSAAIPEAVLWEQYITWSGIDYAAQDFEVTYDIYDIYTGDDFGYAEAWNIEAITTRGGWTSFVDLSNASAIHWYIYADAGGEPAGVPGDGSEFWSISLAPGDPQVALGVSEPEDVVLTLNTPFNLPSGNWWLVHFVSLENELYGQWGWSGSAEPVWGQVGLQNNPGGGFGLPPGWVPNSYSEDFMFRLEGTTGGGPEEVIVQAMSNIGAGDVFAIGDANLWDNQDHEANAVMSLFEFDNAQLAHNVFAFGQICEGCPVALFKDADPWPQYGPMVSSSPEQAAPELDESLLNEMGNLPDDAPVVTIKPMAMGDVVNSFPTPSAGFYGMTWIDNFLWVGHADTFTLMQLDPTNGTVLASIPVAGVTPCGLTWDGSTFWVADCSADIIAQVDMSGTVLWSFPSPSSGPVGLAWDGAYLWDVDFDDDQLHQINPSTGGVVWSIPAPDTRAAGLAWDGQYLWTNGRDSATTYQVNPADGSVIAAFGTPPAPGGNNGMGGAFDGQYLWIANYDVQMIYQIDVEHTPAWIDPNERVLQAWNIPYDVFGSPDMGQVDLAPYCRVIIASDQTQSFYDALSANRAWFENWTADGGMYEFHGADNGWNYGTWLGLPVPGGFDHDTTPTEDVSILDYGHPIVNDPFVITDPELDGWGASSHGYFMGLPAGASNIIAHEPSGAPVATNFNWGDGCMVASMQPLEYGWDWGHSPILENYILYNECGTPQAFAELWIDPPVQEIPFGGEAVVDITITDVENLYGVALELTFDPTVVQVVDVDPGTPGVQIPPGSCPSADFILQNSADNATGVIYYDVASLAPSPPCNGNGIIAHVVFTGVAPGLTSPLHFNNWLLSNSDGLEIPVLDTHDGTLNVSATETIDGYVDLQGRGDDSGVEVCAGATCTTTASNGYFTLDVTPGTYNVTAEMERYLDSEYLGVSTPATLPPVTLQGGDTNDDDIVNIQDLAFMGARYLYACGDPEYDARADINNDCIINIQDLAMTGGNYLETSPVPWP